MDNTVANLKTELQAFEDDLEYNLSEQMELRSMERSIREEIAAIEEKLENLEYEEEKND